MEIKDFIWSAWPKAEDANAGCGHGCWREWLLATWSHVTSGVLVLMALPVYCAGTVHCTPGALYTVH